MDKAEYEQLQAQIEAADVAGQEAKNGWKILLVLAIGFAGALAGALNGVRFDKVR